MGLERVINCLLLMAFNQVWTGVLVAGSGIPQWPRHFIIPQWPTSCSFWIAGKIVDVCLNDVTQFKRFKFIFSSRRHLMWFETLRERLSQRKEP